MVLLAGIASIPPVEAHGGREQPIRPVVTGIEPDATGVSAKVIYTGAWQLRLTNTTERELSILDPEGRPFLQIGPGGVLANFASPSWYESNSPDGLGRAPADLPEPGPDLRTVAKDPSWTWFDARLRADPRALPRDIAESGEGARLGNWSIPVRYGDRTGRIHGYLWYEPVLGTYRHAITSSKIPAPGVTVGLVAAGAIPAMRIENATDLPVTLIGRADEPFARIGTDVEVNLRSPTWQEIAQSSGQVPTITADAAAEPLWRLVLNGPRWSWPEFRGRPPDAEPSRGVATGTTASVVKRWSVPLT
ncbi:MAG: hypothetical protein ACRDV9_12720, partial [Acidimicrobiia bacterium]